MANTALIEEIKPLLRIKSSTAFDSEIDDLIESTKADLLLSGILAAKITTLGSEPDALIKRCVILYCKANFGLDNQDSKKYMAAYESLKTHLTLSQEYTVEEVV